MRKANRESAGANESHVKAEMYTVEAYRCGPISCINSD